MTIQVCWFWVPRIFHGSLTMRSSEGTSTSFLFHQPNTKYSTCRFEKRIYIPLPGPEARRHMFQLHIGDTPNELTQKDFRLLADNTDGYSGSDISVVVRDALMQPVRKVISATHFKRVPDPTMESEELVKWTPCSPGDPAAKEMVWSDIESDELLEPALKIADFLKSLSSVRPTVTEADIKRHDEWTRESGRFPSSMDRGCPVITSLLFSR